MGLQAEGHYMSVLPGWISLKIELVFTKQCLTVWVCGLPCSIAGVRLALPVVTGRGCLFATFQLYVWNSNLLNLCCLFGVMLLFFASSSQCSVLWQVSSSHRDLDWGCTQTLLCITDTLASGLSVLWREPSPHWTCRMWKSAFSFPCTQWRQQAEQQGTGYDRRQTREGLCFLREFCSRPVVSPSWITDFTSSLVSLVIPKLSVTFL